MQAQDQSELWNKPAVAQLVQVVTAIVDEQTMRRFLRDLLTEKEIKEMSARLMAAKMLKEGATYLEIVERTRLSSRTVARISSWLQNGCKGYDAAIEILSTNK
ncbi:MAG TPA: YerC/YecD family TrpR-related protein [Candidatus Saccharimonadales bacterium]|nr:YerC/YecD family TrpR-related protein [Candidatus Saccharimonadales bacterium]